MFLSLFEDHLIYLPLSSDTHSFLQQYILIPQRKFYSYKKNILDSYCLLQESDKPHPFV